MVRSRLGSMEVIGEYSKISPPLKITSPPCLNDKGSFSLSIVKEIVLTMVTEVTFLRDCDFHLVKICSSDSVPLYMCAHLPLESAGTESYLSTNAARFYHILSATTATGEYEKVTQGKTCMATQFSNRGDG